MFIERDDFRDVDSPDFYGLAPGAPPPPLSVPPSYLPCPPTRAAGKTAGLRYAGYVTVTEVVRDPASGAAVELRCTYDHARTGTAAKVRRRRPPHELQLLLLHPPSSAPLSLPGQGQPALGVWPRRGRGAAQGRGTAG